MIDFSAKIQKTDPLKIKRQRNEIKKILGAYRYRRCCVQRHCPTSAFAENEVPAGAVLVNESPVKDQTGDGIKSTDR